MFGSLYLFGFCSFLVGGLLASVFSLFFSWFCSFLIEGSWQELFLFVLWLCSFPNLGLQQISCLQAHNARVVKSSLVSIRSKVMRCVCVCFFELVPGRISISIRARSKGPRYCAIQRIRETTKGCGIVSWLRRGVDIAETQIHPERTHIPKSTMTLNESYRWEQSMSIIR